MRDLEIADAKLDVRGTGLLCLLGWESHAVFCTF